MKMTQASITKLFTSLLTGCLLTSAVAAQQYLEMRQDELIYDIDVVVFARQLSQPSAESINNQASVKTEDVFKLPVWDGEQDLLQYPAPIEPPSDSVPIENQANPVNVLSDMVLTNSMNHPIIDRLKVNPTYKPIYRQKWRQLPSAFLNPQYIEVSNLMPTEANANNELNQSDMSQSNISPADLNRSSLIQPDVFMADLIADYSVDGQVAFSEQRFTHLHVKMNLYRINAEAEQIVYELSQQKRIELDQWQYFDHQQFGVLAKVTAVKLEKGE
jgi:hypothetical protein